MKSNTKHILSIISALAVATCVSKAGIGETYIESCAHYGSEAVLDPEGKCVWQYKGLWVGEWFDDYGRCDFLIMSCVDPTHPMTEEEARQVLVGLLPDNGIWKAYPSGDAKRKCWYTFTPGGTKWLSQYFLSTVDVYGHESMFTGVQVATEERMKAHGLIAPSKSAQGRTQAAGRTRL